MGCAAQNPREVPLPAVPFGEAETPPPATPTSQSAEDERADRRVAALLYQVSALRELAANGPVHARVIDRTQMLEQVKRQVRTQVPPNAIRGESDFLSAFEFVPADFDYEAEVYRLIQSQIAGYYEPDEKVMFLMADLSDDEAEVTLAHELIHALQDQHYDLGPKLGYRADGNDEQSAFHCLAEGDATSLMLDYSLRRHGQVALAIPDDKLRLEIVTSMAVSPELASFPRVLRDSLVSPYVDGILFVHALRRRGGWAAVDAVWRNPPRTTEQVLHLDKLDAREPPEALPVPSAPLLGSGWHATHTDVYGEQGIRVALEEWMPRQVAARAAAGWAGDRSVVWTRGSSETRETAAAWHVRFDLAERAKSPNREAEEAFGSVVEYWGAAPQRGAACRISPQGRAIAVSQRGRDLAFVATPPHAGCALAVRWAHGIVAGP
jgi:hypothetical protein